MNLSDPAIFVGLLLQARDIVWPMAVIALVTMLLYTCRPFP
jgi:hypothetical protein